MDDGINLYSALLPLNIGNIAIIGSHGRGKTNALKLIAKLLNEPMQDGYYEQNTASTIIVDNADCLIEPLSNNPNALKFQKELTSSNTVIFSVKTVRGLRLPDQAPVRIIFPTGDSGTDTMLGIPTKIQQSLCADDYNTSGRAILIYSGSAYLIQLAYCENT